MQQYEVLEPHILRVLDVGISFTTATRVLILEPEWMAADQRQGVKRVHRLGQEKPTFSYLCLNRNPEVKMGIMLRQQRDPERFSERRRMLS